MGYAGERIMCDADSHIMETFDWLKDFADPDIRASIPPLKLGGASRLGEKAIANATAARAYPAKGGECRPTVPAGPTRGGR